jgi:hypothetical protein
MIDTEVGREWQYENVAERVESKAAQPADLARTLAGRTTTMHTLTARQSLTAAGLKGNLDDVQDNSRNIDVDAKPQDRDKQVTMAMKKLFEHYPGVE